MKSALASALLLFSAHVRSQESAAERAALDALKRGDAAPVLAAISDRDQPEAARNRLLSELNQAIEALPPEERLPLQRRAGTADTGYEWYFRIGVASTLIDLGRIDDAIEAYGWARSVPHELGAQVIASSLVTLHGEKGDLGAAWSELAGMATAFGSNAPLVELARADLMLRVGLPEAADLALRNSGYLPGPDEKPKNPEQRRAIGMAMDLDLLAERFEDAAALVDALEARDYGTPRLAFGRAIALERLEDPRGAAALREIARTEPTRGTDEGYRDRARALLAERAMREDDPVAAREWLEPARTENGTEILVAQTRLALGDPDASAADLGRHGDALLAAWRRLVASWAAVPVQAGGSAFLQLARRRDLLNTYLACVVELANRGDTESKPGERAATLLLEVDALGTLARSTASPTTTLDDVRRELVPQDGALLAFLPGPGGSFVLVITAEECELWSTPGDRPLRRRVQTLHRELRRVHRQPARSRAPFRELGSAVANAVLPTELRERLRVVQRIGIIGRELVAGVPFDCLPWQDSWLGLEKAVHYLPSLTLAVAHAQTGVPSATVDLRLAAANVPTASAADHGVPASTLTAAEAGGLLPRAWAAADVEVWADERVTATHILSPGAPARVLALFAHGIYDPAALRPAGVLLHPDGERDGATFAGNLPPAADAAPADMVLLATCGAGRGRARRGDDGAWHLGGTLMQRGTRLVGIAEHDLELSATRALITGFLDELPGQAPDLAMLAARRRVAATHGSPTSWGLLRLEGLATHPFEPDWPITTSDGDEPLFPWAWILGVGVGMCLLAALVLLRSGRRPHPPGAGSVGEYGGNGGGT